MPQVQFVMGLTGRKVVRIILPLLAALVTLQVFRSLSSTSSAVVKEYGSVDDRHVAQNLKLIRPRPRNLRLVFVGDSLTRYQYLSLAYFLKFGRWMDPSTTPNLVNSHSFHHPNHPDQDWNEFFLQSNRMLYPYEACDCLRDSKISLERRYFHDPDRNNSVVFINLNGNETTLTNRGYVGRWNAADIFSSFERHVHQPLLADPNDWTNKDRDDFVAAWEYDTWGDVIRHHVAGLHLGKDTAVVLNAGLHPHSTHVDDLADSVAPVRGLWKTTSYTQHEVEQQAPVRLRYTDQVMCRRLECLDLSWTLRVKPELYFDQYHLKEPVYRILNEDLLRQLGMLPEGYKALARETVLT